jgi:hypothetical protein
MSLSRGRLVYRASIAVLALSVTAALIPSSGARSRYRSRTTELAPGVSYTKINDPKGPWSIRVISIALAEASTIEPVLANDKLPGFERTSSMARRHGAIAAINGDYARESGRPVMLFAQDGELAQTALTWGVNFAVNESETATYIKHQDPDVWLYEPDAGIDHPISQFNAGWPGPDQISGFSHLAGGTEPPPSGACSARLYPTEGARNSERRVGLEQPHVVHEVVCKSRKLWPKGGRVLAAPMAGARAPEITSLAAGDEVELGWSLTWPDVFDTIGGNPTLVKDGAIIVGDGDTAFFNRHPRTGVGTTPDGRVLFVTVDGRQPGYSRGMKLRRFAKLFVSLGADYALNLDGGGSTTMVVNDDVVNRPSDGNERYVSSALVLLPGPDPDPTVSPAPVPTPTSSTSPSPSPSPTSLVGSTSIPDAIARGSTTGDLVWLTIATDPASTGGLTQYLLHEGIRLRGSLRAAARIFHGR